MKITIKLGALSLIASAFLIGCGDDTTTDTNPTETNAPTESQEVSNGTSSDNTTTETVDAPTESNIGYLKNNHANYSNHGSSTFPTPTKDGASKSIDWTISATTEEGAKKLADHIQFMVNKLKDGENPRAWDKLFLMEGYMKVNHQYTTEIEQTGTTVTVSKVATTLCAYDVISAHSDAVSGDFFAQGVINVDYSPKAEAILADSACLNEKAKIEAYILENQTSK